ncbi:MAG: N-acetylmuramoyl-L-alanine amidase [Clostridiales bacterium]|nr:N-acetylmuramoyl-L-alanine amidase [Eubacteriales bacterium]MDH7567728.1 N-acetylmuramoyl-L-alanine amidase [Clostridiales bacterium]
MKDIQGHWAQPDIEKAMGSGYVRGYSDSTFRPNNGITRAEFITMLNTAFSVPLNGANINFKDVHSGDWFALNVWSAAKAGYTNGYPDHTFRPNQFVTRQEAACTIAALTKMADGFPKKFKDSNQIAPWAQQAVNALASNGVLSGDSGGYLHPLQNLTRAEAVVLVNRTKNITGSTPVHLTLSVTGSIVNIRSGPDISSDVIGKVKRGSILTALEHSSNGWYRVQFNNSTGWITDQYVKPSYANRGSDTDREEDGSSVDNSNTGTDPGSETNSGVEASQDEAIDPAAGTGTDTGAQPGTVDKPGTEANPGTDTDSAAGDDAGKEKIIVIDPGHGGSDPGAIGQSGTKEKDITLDIALMVSDYLKNAGYQVIMTRQDDQYVSLADRSAVANDAHADAFISIHCNAYNHIAGGTETFTEPMSGNPVYKQQEDSKRLARLVQSELVQALGLTDRGVNEEGLYVCRETNAPAILVETAFIDNKSEEKLLSDPEFQKKAAEAIGRGVDGYFAK